MKLSKVFRYKAVDNRSIIEEERSGNGMFFAQRHRTNFDPELTKRIRRMSVLEVIG